MALLVFFFCIPLNPIVPQIFLSLRISFPIYGVLAFLTYMVFIVKIRRVIRVSIFILLTNSTNHPLIIVGRFDCVKP